jgi:hypothetical protein
LAENLYRMIRKKFITAENKNNILTIPELKGAIKPG